MQDWWENWVYVVEKCPYPNVPVYVVCPEQSEMDKPVAGVGNDTSLTQVPPVRDAPIEAELSGMVTSGSAGSTSENSPD